MRNAIFGLLVLAGGAMTALADEDRFADVSPRQRATWQLAVHTAARRALEAAERLPEPDADLLAQMHGSLTAAMQADVPAHRRRADSLTLCRTAVRTMLQAALADKMARILEVANEQSTLPVLEVDVKHVAGERYDQVLATALDAFEGERTDALFEKARSDAVALARQAVDQRISPPPFAPLDALLTDLAGTRGVLPAEWPSKIQKRLRAALPSYAGRTEEPVLEEVAAYAEGVANRMVEGIRQQYGRQLAMAERHFEDDKTGDIRIAAALEARVLERLEAELAALPAEDSTTGVPLPVYPVFATVRNHIRQQAETIEAERFARFINQTALLDIDGGELTQRIESDLAAHRTSNASRKRLHSELTASRRPLVVEAYAGAGPEAAGTRAHFATLLAGKAQPASAFNVRLADGLDALLATVRETLADAQYAAAGFATLDALETLPAALLDEVHKTRGAEPKTLDAALSFLERGGVPAVAGGVIPDNLLEEAEIRALGRINALVAAADQAINGQLELLHELEAEKIEHLRRDVAAGRPQKEIRKEWEAGLQRRWQGAAGEITSAYTALTSPVLDVLDKTVRQLYDSILQEQREQMTNPSTSDPAAAAIESEPPPEVVETTIPPPDAADETEEPQVQDAGGGASAGGEAEGEAERPMPDILLVLSGDEADRCNAMLTIAGAEARIEQELAVDDPAAAADVLFARLEPHLAALRESAVLRSREGRGWFGLRRQGQPTLSVHVVVESNAVRHRMSLLLKRRIEEAIGAAPSGEGNASVLIDWQAGLTE